MDEARDTSARPSPLVVWGRLLRLPNLFTVPGDPVAGYLLAAGVLGWKALGAVAASMCLYCAGLLLNDYFDRNVDARERPERPIPSGAVQPCTVLAIGGLLLVAGPAIACAACGGWTGVVAAVTALAVYAYDAGVKHIRQLGPAVMGGCRAGSVLIGAAAAGGLAADPALVVADITWAYTTTVTVLAADEATGKPLGKAAFAPAVVLLAGGCAMLLFLDTSWGVRFFAVPPLLFAIEQTVRAALAVQRGALPVPPFIGRLIRQMLPLQCAWGMWRVAAAALPTAAGIYAGTIVLMFGARATARRFYGS